MIVIKIGGAEGIDPDGVCAPDDRLNRTLGALEPGQELSDFLQAGLSLLEHLAGALADAEGHHALPYENGRILERPAIRDDRYGNRLARPKNGLRRHDEAR